METLVIMLGYRCNFRCEHCIVGKKTETGLTGEEKELIAESVRRHGTKYILFVGGEPTLYIEDMNDIISRFGESQPEVRMTTNGHFAQTKEKALAVLASVPKLSGVNLSYDSLHAKFLPEINIENLYSACREKGLDFVVLMALRSPMDLVMMKGLRRIGDFKVWIQKLLPAGSARDNNLGYKYPSFNDQVLKASCPTRKKVIYMCGQGFTNCCSGLVFETKTDRFVFSTVEELFSSEFYKLMSSSSFGKIIQEFGLSGLTLRPEDSEPCTLCEHIYKAKYGADL